jgi:hypothetical protein
MCEELANDPLRVIFGTTVENAALEMSLSGNFNKDLTIDD